MPRTRVVRDTGGVNAMRVAVVLLLAWAAYWAALPWIECASPDWLRFRPGSEVLRWCTFGGPPPNPTPPSALWPNLIVGALYVVVAVVVALRRKPL